MGGSTVYGRRDWIRGYVLNPFPDQLSRYRYVYILLECDVAARLMQ